MKIVFLSDDFPPQSFGGAGISTYDLALGMKEAGHDVFVITTCRKENEAGESQYNGLHIYKIATEYQGRWRAYRSLYNPSVVRKVDSFLKHTKPDIVHINNVHFYLSYHCFKLARKYAKVVWTARDVMSFSYGKLETERFLKNFDYRLTWLDHVRQAGKRWNPLRNIIIRKYVRCAHKLFAVSDALKNALFQNGIRNVEVMHTGMPLHLWGVTDAEILQFKKRFNLENKKVLLFGGRLDSAKGDTQTLQAMVSVVKKIPNAVLFVVGKIDGRAQYIKKEAEKLGIGDHIIFTDWIKENQMKYMYAISDVVVVPSICFDAFPRIVLEAMVSKKPVIGTCYGGAPEIIVDGVTGYVVNPFKVEDMARKIIDVLGNEVKKNSFGLAGYERVRNLFNLKDKIKMLSVVYKELIERK